MPESIPWLVAQGRIREAKQILASAARMNKVTLPKEFQLTEEDEQLLTDKPAKEEKTAEPRRASISLR